MVLVAERELFYSQRCSPDRSLRTTKSFSCVSFVIIRLKSQIEEPLSGLFPLRLLIGHTESFPHTAAAAAERNEAWQNKTVPSVVFSMKLCSGER